MVKENTREVLLSAATKLFSEKGYLNTSIREIAKELNISSSVLYHHFKNKEEILYIIINNIGSYFLSSLEKIQKNETDPVEALREMIVQSIFLMDSYRQEAKIAINAMDEVGSLTGRARNEVLSYGENILGIYVDQLKKLEKLNMLRQGDLKIMAFSIFGIVNWFYYWQGRFAEKDAEIEETTNQIIDRIFFGILAK